MQFQIFYGHCQKCHVTKIYLSAHFQRPSLCSFFSLLLLSNLSSLTLFNLHQEIIKTSNSIPNSNSIQFNNFISNSSHSISFKFVSICCWRPFFHGRRCVTFIRCSYVIINVIIITFVSLCFILYKFDKCYKSIYFSLTIYIYILHLRIASDKIVFPMFSVLKVYQTTQKTKTISTFSF